MCLFCESCETGGLATSEDNAKLVGDIVGTAKALVDLDILDLSNLAQGVELIQKSNNQNDSTSSIEKCMENYYEHH